MKKLLLFLLLPLSLLANDRTPVSCGPSTTKQITATVSSIRDGDWYNPSTWATGKVPAETDLISFSHNLTSTKNIVIRGNLTATKGKITFLNVDERKFVGSTMDVQASDVGLWVMGAGQLNLTGTAKTSWTNALGSITKGSTTIVVASASGWNEGDEIVIVPTEKPTNSIDWNDATNQPIDPMIDKFERRIISQVNGNQISFATPLKYDHLSVTSSVAGKTWTAEVENLSRSIVIEGTAKGRSHIFIMSSKPHTVKYVEGRWLGPRMPTRRSGDLITGRYGMHFHHCGTGSEGTIVEGNAFHDIGNRVYVPHISHGITFRDNVAHDMMEQPQFWDFQDQTHRTLFEHNIQSLRRYNGVNAGSVTGNELGQGDDNIMRRNVAVYIHHGDSHQQGAYSWNTDNVGVWIFEDNLSHSNITGLFVWQNDNANHTIRRYTSYNDELGIHHGAYINEYNYIDCIFFNSMVSFEATQGNTNPMFSNLIVDGGGKLRYLVTVLSSPVPAGQSNIFVNPILAGYTEAAVQINTELFQGEQGRKVVDLVNPTAPNDKLFAFGPRSIYNSMGRAQLKGGQSYQVTQSGRSNISAFSLNEFGKGTGLRGKYYNGENFNQLAMERIDPMVKFQQWSLDPKASPNAVHNKINPAGPYSIIWEGYYSPQSSGQTTFAFESFGGVRLWVDGRQLLNRWTENNERVKFDAPAIALEVGKKYKVRIEHFNTSGERGIQWYTKSGNSYLNVPISQLEPELSTDPDPVPNRPPVVSAGKDIVTTDTLFKIEGSASDPDNNLTSVKWSGTGVTLTQNLSDAAHVMVKAKPGVYELTLTATDQGNLSVSDKMVLLIQPKVDTSAPVNPCSIFDPVFYLKKYPDVAKNWGGTALSHYEQFGKKEGRIINAACEGSFKNKIQTGSNTCLNGQIITFTVPAGKYTSTSQSLADAMAVQELNAELAKCPQPYATFDLDNKKIYVFKTGDTYQFFIK